MWNLGGELLIVIRIQKIMHDDRLAAESDAVWLFCYFFFLFFSLVCVCVWGVWGWEGEGGG